MKTRSGFRRFPSAASLWAWTASAVGLLLALAPEAGAESYHLHFDSVSVDEGLPQVSANAVLQDEKGFIWIGTQEGLCRFDGYEVFVYKREPENPASLASNFIRSLYLDQAGFLWIVSQPGELTRYEPRTGHFRRFLSDPEDPGTIGPGTVNPSAFYEDEEGNLWISVFGHGLEKIARDGTVEHVIHDPDDPESLPGNVVSTLVEDREGHLWVGFFDGGIARRVTSPGDARERFVAYRPDPEDPASLGPGQVTSLLVPRGGELYVGIGGTAGSGVYRFDRSSDGFVRLPYPESLASTTVGGAFADSVLFSPHHHLPSMLEDRHGHLWARIASGLLRWSADRGEVRHYRNDPKDPRSLSSNAVSAIYEDRAGDVWVGHFQGGGLNRYEPENDAFERFVRDPSDPHSLSSNIIANIFEDRSGILWFGTSNGGVSRFSRDKHQFKHHRRPATAAPGEDDNMIMSVLVDREGTLWAASLESGVYRFDQERRNIVERYFADPGGARDIGTNFVRMVHQDARGRIWLGTQGVGLVLIDPRKGEVVRRYSHDPDDETTISNNFVIGIDEDRQGILWISTVFGWNRFDPEKGVFQRYFQSPGDPWNSAWVTYEDPSGELWVGTVAGVARFDRESETFEKFEPDPKDPKSLSSGNVMDFHADEKGRLYVATYGGGLHRLDPKTGEFTHFHQQDGLPGLSLYSVLPDDDGHLWISSNYGLSRFDLGTETFAHYDKDDGLQSNEFNGRSFFKTPQGELLFGGVNGITSFFPRDIVPRSYKPPVALTVFKKFDRIEIFDSTLDEMERITLSYKDSFFGFEFSSLDYDTPSQNRYAYKLEGFDRDWVESGSRRYATYTNLDGGTYTFRVKGSNSDGVWSDETASIEVVIVPPPWKTWWAYVLYALAAGAAIFGYVRFKTKRHQAEMRLQREELERQRLVAERLQQIDTMKDEFLANTSHELRTPLNGIIGIAESLLDGATGELAAATRSNLFMISSSGRRLAHLVDDILDFSKLKNREIELRKRAVSLRELVEIVLTLSRPLIGERKIVLGNRIPEDLPRVLGDENRLQQILYNLVGNAVKFTEEGSVTVDGRAEDGFVEMTVADTGIGISSEKLDRIFESFEQADASSEREYGGTGLGLTITRQLVDLHGGSIRAESQVGQGSRMIVQLPIAGSASETSGDEHSQLSKIRHRLDEARSTEGKILTASSELALSRGGAVDPGSEGRNSGGNGAGGNGAGGGGARETEHLVEGAAGLEVLVVDDEPVNLQVMQNILTLASYRVTQAQNGLQALDILDGGFCPDLVLLDVMMPRMTGFEVARRMRARHSANDLPIILVTAKNQVSDLMEGLASGANDYITKPFSKDELLARIETHVSLSKAHSVEAENQRRTRELEQARAIQLSMLPADPPELDYLEIAAYLKTATEVGGDYYDFFPQADGSLYVATGDATGHGISAGMMVSMTKSALKALDVQSPHVLLTQLNRVFREVHLQRMKMALNVAYITDSEVALASAAMPPVFFYRAATGEVSEILVSGLPLGSLTELSYRLEVLELHPGDVLLMISDGLPEALDAGSNPLGYAAVSRCLAEHASAPAEEIVRLLVEMGETWADGEKAPEDDVTVIVLKRR